MKKFLALLLTLVLAVALVACGNDITTEAPTTEAPTTEAPTTDTPTTADTTAPVLSGVEDKEIFLNEDFDPLEGVSAIDDVDGDITSEIVLSGLSLLDTSKTGEYFLKYSIEDSAGNLVEQTRWITVVLDPSTIGDGVPQNGDFSAGAGVWSVAEVEGGAGVFSVEDEVGLLTITTPGWTAGFPRFDSAEMDLENGLAYEVSFRAKADAARPIQVQVGELLPASPWFVDYMPVRGAIVYDLTTEWQTFTFEFIMNQDGDEGDILPGQLLFGHGLAIESDIDYPEENYTTVVYYDDVVVSETTLGDDEEAPIISGAIDKTVEVGTDFDPLEGVTAADVIDGEITLDDTHYVSDVDTSTPGEYTVVYTVSDEAGNVATETITITVVGLVFDSTTEIVDGSFTTTDDIIAEVQDANDDYADITPEDVWYYYLATHDPEFAAATATVTDGAAVIDVTAGGNNDWAVMLKQKGLSLVQGETYKLTFTASATADRDIVAKVTDNYSETFDLTSTSETFSFIFTYEEADRLDARVIFLLGNTTNFAVGEVTIDDVELSVLDQEELVSNGEFDNIGWGVYSHDEASTIGIVDGELVVDVANVGTEAYSVQLFQNDVPLVDGTEYTLSFYAKASVARDIIFKIMTPGYVVQAEQTFTLTDTLTEYTFTFTYNSDVELGQINFELGDIDSATAGTVTFDDIELSDATANVAVNSSFDQAIGWGTYSHVEGDVNAAMDVEVADGELVANVINIGTAFWNNQIFQEGIEVVPGVTYTLVFDAKSSVARDMSFVFIDANKVEFRETYDLTTEMETYTFTFTYDGTATTGKLDFELGNISDSSVAAVVTFDNINFYRNFNFAIAEEELPLETTIAYGNMDLEYVLTYGVIPTSWWDYNLQAKFNDFDETKTSIDITFIGENGQDYLFKVEGGGVDTELAMTADGTEQTVTLDLSSFTEEERAGLNLLIIFVHNSDDPIVESPAGTLRIKPIDGIAAEWNAYGDMSLSYDVTYGTVPADVWYNNNFQAVVADFDDSRPEIEFTFIGEAGQEYNFKFTDSSTAYPDEIFVDKTVTATGSEQTVLLDLTTLTAEQIENLDLLVVFAITEDATGTISIIDWDHPDWIAYNNIEVTETASGAEITYEASPSTVWDNNVQSTIEDFDGTEESVTFTVTGETGHEYLIKVEGADGFAQTQFVATGSSEEVVISLSELSEEARGNLNLIVVFVIESDAAGTLLIEGWDYTATAE